MKVVELMDILNSVDQDAEVVMASNEEGTGYHIVNSVDSNSNFIGDYYVEIGVAELTDELLEQGYTEDDLLDGEPCIVLWP